MVTNKIVHGKWLFAGSGKQRNVIRDGAVYIEDGVIRDIGKYSEISKVYRCDVELGSEAHIVMPGLINAHDHGFPYFTWVGVRDTPLEMWLPQAIFLLQRLVPDFFYSALLTCIRLIESGVTTTIHHFYGRDPTQLSEYEKDLEEAMRAHIDSGMRVAFAPSIQDQNEFVYMDQEKFVSELPKDIIEKFWIQIPRDEYYAKRVECYFKAFDKLLEKYGNHDRVKLMLGPTAVQWCSDDLLRKIKKKAQERNIGIHTHLLETEYQRDYGLRVYGKSLLQHLGDLNFLGPEVSCAHCIWLTEQDTDILAETKAIAVHNPSSNLRTFAGIAPVVPMIEKGVSVALGIDNLSINDDEDMFQEMRLCSLLHRNPGVISYQRYSRTLDSFKILDMATTEDAKAAGFGGKIGAIRLGAEADLILVNMKNASHRLGSRVPIEDSLLCCAKGSDVDTVIVDGEVIMKDRKFVKLDKPNLFSKIKESIKDVDTETGEKIDEYVGYIKRYYESWDKDAAIS